MEKQCLLCGEGELVESTRERHISDAFGGDSFVTLSTLTCSVCGESEDFSEKNDVILNHAYLVLKKKAVTNILTTFNSNGISLSALERSLDLPQRMLSKWKQQRSDPSASAVTLLKLVSLFPWLIEVADKGFDPIESKRIFLNIARDNYLKYCPEEMTTSRKIERTSSDIPAFYFDLGNTVNATQYRPEPNTDRDNYIIVEPVLCN